MSRRENLENIAYIVYWSVELDESNNVIDIDLHRAMDMSRVEKNEWPIFTDFKPNEEFTAKAKNQIMNLDWSDYEPNEKYGSAHSYLYSADPNNPVTSNDQSR